MLKSILKFTITILMVLTIFLVIDTINSNWITNILYHKDQEFLSDGIYQECIVSDPNEIFRVLIQDDLNDLDKQKATFYDFNKKPHPAHINIDPVDGVTFISDLNSSDTAFMTVDYVNHKCEISILRNSLNTIYDKKGYYGFSNSIDDIDDLFYKLSKIKHSTVH